MDSSRPAERFVAAYNRVEKALARVSQLDIRRSFPELVSQAARHSSVVRAHQHDLLKYGQLRNVIVHERIRPDYFIADPRADVVEQFEQIADILEAPPRVIPLFRKDVRRLRTDDPFLSALEGLREHRLYQFPVYGQGHFAGLLNERSIARWLAQAGAGGSVSLADVRVGDVLPHDKTRGRNVEFLAADATLYDAAELFTERPHHDRPVLDAILITQNGRRDESPLGIIIAWDMIEPLERA